MLASGVDEIHNSRSGRARDAPRVLEFVHLSRDASVCAGACSIVGSGSAGRLQNARQSSGCKRFGGYCFGGDVQQ
jgi:hypothetical protein